MQLKNQYKHAAMKFCSCPYPILPEKKEFINTSPPGERVGLTKSLYELEQLEPNSKDLTYKSNIDRYVMRPRQLATWCLADYVAKN